ncbi:ankyrin repeat domain-containing protein 39 [Diorhabda carinulata]|uniref:ankyrin repeat domain-containing protein 39 n=1 Tax=Diorhabda carinulata TaxID=1163345 RepID=UPI0025A2112B|nr:ankyrin repeat domain-containing protein 39 [Diorhabda carinulata]XP_057668147.1 ankyrin repeat domain-containing protein 39 [Diorhabda carinulata]
MESQNECDHNCTCSTYTVATQSLDEMDFERGIWYAAQYGDLERVKKLVKDKHCVNMKDSAGYTALHYAARNGHFAVCKFLLENGAQVDAITKGHSTALCRAALTGKEDIVDLLLSNNANPLIKDSDGKTALHRAAENKHYGICKKLLSVAPILNEMKDNRGNVPDIGD